jgi:predicted transposase/invertase (TIGR01784 family)
MSKKTKDNNLSQPHARTFEYVLRNKEAAASLLKEYLPVKIRNKLDFRTLRISNIKYIDKKLKDYFSDLLYEIKLKPGHKSVFIWLLFEHKCREEWFICLQLLKYMVGIWELYLKQNEKAKYLPVIIPLVIYHGKPKWSISERFVSLFEEPSEMEGYIPDFKYNLYDISHMPDEQIRGTPLLKIFLTTFKYIYSPELKKKLWEIFKLFLELSDKSQVSEYLEILLRYLFNSPGDYSKDEIREQVTTILEGGGDVMQTIAQQLREEGKHEGIKIGEKRGKHEGIKIGEKRGEKRGKEYTAKETAIRMLKKGFDLNTIVEITGLEPSEIKKLRD